MSQVSSYGPKVPYPMNCDYGELHGWKEGGELPCSRFVKNDSILNHTISMFTLMGIHSNMGAAGIGMGIGIHVDIDIIIDRYR